MVDEFLTDDEQAERTKAWLRSNGIFIVAGALLGVGILFGLQQWREYRLEVAGQASVVWEQLRGAIEGGRDNEVSETLALLESDYADTPYVDSARLAMAAMHMGKSQPEAAVEQLQKLVKAARDPHLKQVGELRLAQVLIYLERYDEALELLGTNDNSALASQYHDLRGDALFAQGYLEAAQEEYEQALETDEGGIIDRSFVQIKLDDVAGSIVTQSANGDPDADEGLTELGEQEAAAIDGAEPSS